MTLGTPPSGTPLLPGLFAHCLLPAVAAAATGGSESGASGARRHSGGGVGWWWWCGGGGGGCSSRDRYSRAPAALVVVGVY